MPTEAPARPRKMTAAMIAQEAAVERIEAANRRAEEIAHQIEEATARNEAALSAVIQIARMMGAISERMAGLAPATQPQPAPAPQTEPQAEARPEQDRNTPRTGRQLYAWAVKHQMVAALMEIGEGRRYPRRIVDWDSEQTRTAYYDLFDSDDDAREEPDPEPSQDTGYGL